MIKYFLNLICKLDELALLMTGLIFYIGVCIISFASRYMKGDTKYRAFFMHIILLMTAVVTMVTTDNIVMLIIAVCLSNCILVRLMIHKPTWKAARASGMIAAKNYALSAVCMAGAFVLLYFTTGNTSINTIVHHKIGSIVIPVALVLLLVAAMIQSAIWPFHGWLLSSLNSPTPVSAIMHAGIINGGGFLLVRFANLYTQYPILMSCIFIVGIVTALLGTLWKLMQSDVKRMLACSTMAQMGFMFVQCGLGLFPLAVAHLFWHGMFKAYLFLASGSAAQEKRFDLNARPSAISFIYAFLCGLAGSFVFAYTSNKSWFAGDSSLVLMVIVLLAGSQLSLSILHTLSMRTLLISLVSTITAAFVYGVSVYSIAWFIAPMKLMYPQPLNILHIGGIILLSGAWLSSVFIRNLLGVEYNSPWMLKSYVESLNASQPHSDAVTSHRNHYQYQ